jgi:3-carboxymethyl-3-hydroxy-acyl-[acp] dehydratase
MGIALKEACMDNLSDRPYETLQVRSYNDVCFIQIDRPEANNTINDQLIEELGRVLDRCEDETRIVVLEGSPEVFCFGADFKALQQELASSSRRTGPQPEPMYNLWSRLAAGPYVTIAHVRGQVNAGGIGFVAACDVVICDEQATFSLSELLFGLMPACVLPFLVRRIGYSKAHYMTLMTEPVSAKTAQDWGLVDDVAADSANLLRKKLLRLRRLSKTAVRRYKRYLNTLDDSPAAAKLPALAANIEVFSDQVNLEKISRYVRTGQFPWEGE